MNTQQADGNNEVGGISSEVNKPSPLTLAQVFNKAWPIILANAAVPTLGLVDTAVIGHFGQTSELAALAIASLVFSFVYWCFGFLRMGTTAYVAQAEGAGSSNRLMLVVVQSLAIALAIAFCLIVGQHFLLDLALIALAPPGSVAGYMADYFNIRIWGAPATLLIYVCSGYLIGRGFSKQLLLLQLILNASNASLDLVFAGTLSMGLEGVALGTLIAEYLTAAFALVLISRSHPWVSFLNDLSFSQLRQGFAALISQNRDIFIRTLFLLLAFGFFARKGGSFGEETLAANHILLQFISFSAFFMDGFAHVLESLVGKAFGARSKPRLLEALKQSSILAGLTALLLSICVFGFGQVFISLLTNKELVQQLASSYLVFSSIYIFLSVAAFQLDGLFIGAAYGAAMRNCSVISTLSFFALWFFGMYHLENLGLWLCFIFYVCVRAFTLAAYLPKLFKFCTSTQDV